MPDKTIVLHFEKDKEYDIDYFIDKMNIIYFNWIYPILDQNDILHNYDYPDITKTRKIILSIEVIDEEVQK